MAGVWSVILPETGTNLVLNPVAMGVGNYAAIGATSVVTAETTYSYLGYKCYKIVSHDFCGIQLKGTTKLWNDQSNQQGKGTPCHPGRGE